MATLPRTKVSSKTTGKNRRPRQADSAQLELSAERTWKLDPRTQDIGRRGVAEARAALRRATSGEQPHIRSHQAA